MTLTINKLNIEGVSEEAVVSVETRLGNILSEWEGTPYIAGQQVKQAGVDCVRFVSAVLDELYGVFTELERLPQDTSFHSRSKCWDAFKGFLTRYSYEEVVDGKLQPGDVIIAGPLGGGPGHALIVGVDCLWHCDSKTVTRTGTAMIHGGVYFLKKVLRGTDRERWCSCA